MALNGDLAAAALELTPAAARTGIIAPNLNWLCLTGPRSKDRIQRGLRQFGVSRTGGLACLHHLAGFVRGLQKLRQAREELLEGAYRCSFPVLFYVDLCLKL